MSPLIPWPERLSVDGMEDQGGRKLELAGLFYSLLGAVDFIKKVSDFDREECDFYCQ